MNVQQLIISGIRELLYSHNYVVLPGFGGFVLKESPAHVSVSGGLLFPPSKTVGFNSQLKQNDGVLAVWLERKLSCTSSEALSHTQEFTDFCRGLLQVKRRFNLDGIGFFYLDFENNICFEPLQDANFLTESFGLGSISIRPLETETVAPKQEPVFEDRRELPIAETAKPQRRNYRKLVYPSLLGLILATLLGLLVNNIKMTGALQSSVLETSGKHNYKPFSYPTLAIAAHPGIKTTYVADANGVAHLQLDENKSLAVRVNEGLSTAENFGAEHQTKGFEIVLGCFSVKANAHKMIKKLSKRRVKAIISGQNAKGLFVVSKGSFRSKEEAVLELDKLKENFPNAWIKKAD